MSCIPNGGAEVGCADEVLTVAVRSRIAKPSSLDWRHPNAISR
jgi:hypothetical protein